jgi:predicted amidohydrolase YtcJ
VNVSATASACVSVCVCALHMGTSLLVRSAVAVQDGLVVAIGTSEGVLAQYPDARAINLLGQTVLPGLIDAHAHLLGLGLVRQTANLVGATSVADVRARLECVVSSCHRGRKRGAYAQTHRHTRISTHQQM